MRILIAEDETTIARALKAMLEHSNYAVDVVHNGFDALDYIRSINYDAWILDIMMPGMDGIKVLKTVRAEGNATPALFLTAKAEIADRVAGLDAGADDYLPKPFAPDELLSRLRAMLRRGGEYRPQRLTVGDLSMECGSGMLCCGTEAVRLSGREYQVMELLMRSPGVIFSTDKIMESVWGWDSESEVSVVWVHISNLRKKLKAIGSAAAIRVIRGMGYVLEAAK